MSRSGKGAGSEQGREGEGGMNPLEEQRKINTELANYKKNKALVIDGEINNCKRILEELDTIIQEKDGHREEVERHELKARNKLLEDTLTKIKEESLSNLHY